MFALAPSAISAATSLVSSASSVVGSVSVAPQAADPSFGQMLDKMTTDAVSSVKTGEAAAISAVEGKISVQEAVDKIMSAERSLQTMIAVRDKVVSAYQEISKMTI
jgi:flagellar hook-basal body complex protein FliE